MKAVHVPQPMRLSFFAEGTCLSLTHHRWKAVGGGFRTHTRSVHVSKGLRSVIDTLCGPTCRRVVLVLG